MIVTLTARRLKPGTHDDFRAAFERVDSEAPDEARRRWPRVYVTRDVTDENVMLTFGLFDGTAEELREIQAEHSDYREDELDTIGTYVDEVLLDGSYEVLNEITR